MSNIIEQDKNKDIRITKSSSIKQFLQCHLAPDTNILLPIEQVTEVMTIPLEKLTPIAHLPSWVMGVYNWRGEVLWVVDLSHLLGLAPWRQDLRTTLAYSTVILRGRTDSASSVTERQQVGFVVTLVREIERLDPDTIQSSPVSSALTNLSPFFSGYWVKPSGEIFACLNVDTLLTAMPKN